MVATVSVCDILSSVDQMTRVSRWALGIITGSSEILQVFHYSVQLNHERLIMERVIESVESESLRNNTAERRMRGYILMWSFDLSAKCSGKINLTVKDTESGLINMSWTPPIMDPGSNSSGMPTYLVFYTSSAQRAKNFTLITNLTSAVIDYLPLNAWYTIEVAAFFSGSKTFERGCPVLLKTQKRMSCLLIVL